MTKSFADKVILKDINLTIEDRDRIGLIGVNGAGKTTLLNVIVDRTDIDAGEVFIERNVNIGYLRQNTGLDRNNTIYYEMLSVFSELKQIEETLRDLEQKMAVCEDHDSEAYLSLSEE